MRQPAVVFALVVAALLLPGVRKLSAQPVTVAKIPFPFIVEGAVLPAGEYRLAMRQGDQATMRIASTCGRVAAFVSVSPSGAVTDTGEPTLVFRRIGNGYVLSKVNIPGEQGREIVAARALGPTSADAQSPTLPIPVRVETLASARLGEPREFWVSLPDRYNESAEKYPVLYMMDGDFNFNSGVIGGVRQAASLGETPEFIIVGIKNTNRSKDIFPEEITYPDGSKDGGRANQYLDFLREELIPRVAKTYRTSDYRILYGTSNTGFTTVHALFRNPDLANAYIAASATLSVPSFQSARDKLIADYKGGTRQLVLVMGENDLPTVLSLNAALKEAIGTAAPAGLTCGFRVIENGDHVPPGALLEGLRAIFFVSFRERDGSWSGSCRCGQSDLDSSSKVGRTCASDRTCR